MKCKFFRHIQKFAITSTRSLPSYWRHQTIDYANDTETGQKRAREEKKCEINIQQWISSSNHTNQMCQIAFVCEWAFYWSTEKVMQCNKFAIYNP